MPNLDAQYFSIKKYLAYKSKFGFSRQFSSLTIAKAPYVEPLPFTIFKAKHGLNHEKLVSFFI